ncbi:hypothetical protein PIB30_025009 [Stylosanthes scabra]|uniref:Protein arginine N-methyltransferase domain-containing protein n=1 Tax=Stylosanthes scabra TaxID=79078 RepID=A0ABU6Z9D4_9FABA|nr:hypothetical protein [Stylosanthes scabra]
MQQQDPNAASSSEPRGPRRKRQRTSRRRGRPVTTQRYPPLGPDEDRGYFQFYSHLGVHEEMLKDQVRTSTYRKAIMYHQASIEGKVVLDVGCGTGILAIFCAQAGARKVYAVEACEFAGLVNSVVEENQLSDIIDVLHGRVEEVEIPEQVDVIVSEWMGYMLVFESMLASVIAARDRWLKQDGLILPSSALLYMAPITNPERYSETVDFWRDVHGIDMSVIRPYAKQCAFQDPWVETITPANILAWPHLVTCINCHTITIPELDSFQTSFNMRSVRKAPLHGFAFWFDVDFTGKNEPTYSPIRSTQATSILVTPPERTQPPPNWEQVKEIVSTEAALELLDLPLPPSGGGHNIPPPVLSTAPNEPPTHWEQTMLYFYDPVEVENNQPIEGTLTLSQNPTNKRFLDIRLELILGGLILKKETTLR